MPVIPYWLSYLLINGNLISHAAYMGLAYPVNGEVSKEL
jgi:hypothetical protein